MIYFFFEYIGFEGDFIFIYNYSKGFVVVIGGYVYRGLFIKNFIGRYMFVDMFFKYDF